MKKLFANGYLIFILLFSLFLYFPSFFNYFTHDDFFHLILAKVENPKDFIKYFNIITNAQGYGFYRPLTTQVFYFLGRYVFDLNVIWMHVISFSVFSGLTGLIYLFAHLIVGIPKVSKTAVFLYATSSIHFMNLYFLGAFQEIGMAFLVMLSIVFYIRSESIKNLNYYLSLTFFTFALASKETAVVTPLLIIISRMYIKLKDVNKVKIVTALKLLLLEIKSVSPYFGILFIYLYFRFFHYGFVSGDSYVWDFSPRILNTLFWYGLWAYNIPEMLVDFIGPGFNFNPNLFKFWSDQIIPILFVWGAMMIILLINVLKLRSKILKLIIFSFIWFLVSISPVMFLPYHKFVYYLTLPLIGLTIFTAYLLTQNKKNYLAYIFMILWFIGSYFTLRLTKETHWVQRGAQTAERIDNYFRENNDILEMQPTITFVDTDKDGDLPWKPSEILKASLSDENYFKVFHPGEFVVYYGNEFITDNAYIIEARQFIGY